MLNGSRSRLEPSLGRSAFGIAPSSNRLRNRAAWRIFSVIPRSSNSCSPILCDNWNIWSARSSSGSRTWSSSADCKARSMPSSTRPRTAESASLPLRAISYKRPRSAGSCRPANAPSTLRRIISRRARLKPSTQDLCSRLNQPASSPQCLQVPTFSTYRNLPRSRVQIPSNVLTVPATSSGCGMKSVSKPLLYGTGVCGDVTRFTGASK